MRRIDRTAAGYLRADQRAWASDNLKYFLFNLQPGSDKAQSTVHHTSGALTANLDVKRKGIEGVWYGYNATLTLVGRKDPSS